MTHRRSDTRLGEARAYHPRGRTVRDRQGRGGRGGDPFRSALQVFDAPPDTEAPAQTVPDTAPTPRQTPAKPRPPRAVPKPRTAGKSRPAAKATGKSTGRGRPAPRKASAARRGGGGPPRLANPVQRLRLATALALALLAVIGVRLVELQLTDGPAYAASGLESRLQTVTLPAARGAIFDRNGNVLAHSVEARFVFADPAMVTDPDGTAAALQPLLGIPASELAERMRPALRGDGSESRFEWLARGVDTATAEQIRALNLPGIGIDQDERRMVPGNDLAANLIGFTGADLVGLEGLEAHFDEVLRGVDGERTYEGGAGASVDREIPGGFRTETAPQPGHDLQLTIDVDLQYEVQRILAEQLRPAQASFGAAVVLDPRTGQVLAQASYPSYNASDPLGASAADRVDAASGIVFDPGSTHKPLVFGAALEEGVIAPGDTLVVDPAIVKGDQSFQDTIPHAHGTELTLSAVMAFSSNVGTIMVADRLGSEKLYQYQQAFGLGTPTGVGLPGEAAGALLAPADWYGSSYGSVPIGHSVDVTAVQLAAAYGAIANDGVWVQPQLVQAVVGPDGSETAAQEPTSRRVLSGENAAYLRELLEAVVGAPGGTGAGATVPDYRVGGKTGTGKLVVDGAYAEGDVATFVGMAPIDHPRYVIAVVAHTPQGGGGEVASPAFQEMAGFTLKHYRVPPASGEPPVFELYP